MSELERRGAMDAKLLSLARKSPQEISDLTGLDAKFVAERISQLLESRDWLSDRQQERLLLEEIADLKDMVLDRVRFADDKDFAATANVALRTLKLISERLDSRRKLVDADIESITQSQAKIFGKAFDAALSHVVNVLGSEVEPEIVDGVVEDGLKAAAKSLQESIVVD